MLKNLLKVLEQIQLAYVNSIVIPDCYYISSHGASEEKEVKTLDLRTSDLLKIFFKCLKYRPESDNCVTKKPCIQQFIHLILYVWKATLV